MSTNTSKHMQKEDDDALPPPPQDDDSPFFHGAILLIKNKGWDAVITLKQGGTGMLGLRSGLIGESAKSGNLQLNTNTEDKWVVEMLPSRKGFALRNSKFSKSYLSMNFEVVKEVSRLNENTTFQVEPISAQQLALQKSMNPEFARMVHEPLWALRGRHGWALSMKPNFQLQGAGFVGPYEQWEVCICGSESFIK